MRHIIENKVIVEYLNSTPVRVEEFNISDFEYFAMIKINEKKERENRIRP
jgi:hypothetical protein